VTQQAAAAVPARRHALSRNNKSLMRRYHRTGWRYSKTDEVNVFGAKIEFPFGEAFYPTEKVNF